jgi:hypothetical protein
MKALLCGSCGHFAIDGKCSPGCEQRIVEVYDTVTGEHIDLGALQLAMAST